MLALLDYLSSKTVLTQLAGLVFSLLSIFHIAVPALITAPAVAGAALLVLTTATMILRFHAGAPGADAKVWWQSRTIIANAVAAAVAIAVLAGTGGLIDQAAIVDKIMILVALVNLVLHGTTTAPIAGSKAA